MGKGGDCMGMVMSTLVASSLAAEMAMVFTKRAAQARRLIASGRMGWLMVTSRLQDPMESLTRSRWSTISLKGISYSLTQVASSTSKILRLGKLLLLVDSL